jgi:2-succinyl-5-enolpyruvyl-6-hydroxy-3-cyclohexene-1-carboxylate synthase
VATTIAAVPDPPHTVETHRHLRAFVDELVRCGMREACTSPGSRNSPLVLSLVRDERLRCFSHIDERCGGFFAVGAAKGSGRPVAVTCTSGTAAAELAPAVVEAHWARVPLIVLTADRPAQLRDVGAGQAIDQIKLYGDAVKWFCEVELPPRLTAASMRWVRQLACRAYWTALEGRPGPVHLNVPLREPLVLSEPLSHETEFPGRADGRRWVGRGPLHDCKDDFLSRTVRARPVVVAGGVGADERLQAAVSEFAERVGAPVFADAMSAARSGPNAIATYDLLLREPELAARLRPEQVIRVGDLPTSTPLRAWLGDLGPEVRQILIDPHATWQDPDAVVEEIWAREPVHQLQMLAPSSSPDPTWLRAWTDADDAAASALEHALAGAQELSEPLVARRLGEWLGPETTLFVAASMPIRDVELYLPARRPLPRVLANRGANGIDGTVSSAFGVTAADPDRPVVLLIGDVALLHDLGGLIAARRLGLPLTIVVLNNDGGGIFNFLAVSGEGAAFEQHIATPHGLSLQRAAALFELEYLKPQTESELRAALARCVGAETVTLIEVRTDRVANLALHRTLADAGLAAVGPG